MRGILIKDGARPQGGGGLSFDLVDILTVLGAPVIESRWRVRNLWYVSHAGTDIAAYTRAEAAEELLDGREMVAAAHQARQVLDGEFEALRGGAEHPWLMLRAVDGSWWEVYSDDPSALRKLRAAFRDVEEIPADRRRARERDT